MKKYYSPGRVNLIGEHIDYNGGNVLPVAINFGTYAEVNIIAEKIIRLYSENFEKDGVYVYVLGTEVKRTSKWFDYVLGVIDVLMKNNYVLKQGFEIKVRGTIPNQSGLSSSASLEVLMAYVLSDLNAFNISREQMAVYCKHAENDFVGVNCGIMDQFIISNAQKNTALNLNCSTLKYDLVNCDLGQYKIIVMNSNVKRTLVDSAYNQRANECQQALEVAMDRFDVTNLCELNVKQIYEIEKSLAPVVFKRLKHVVSEQERVMNSVIALEKGDINKFGELMLASHSSLRDDYEVSCKELDFLVSTAVSMNAVGARMTGAGFGGCAIALVNDYEVDKFIKEITRAYFDEFEINLSCFVVEIEGGVCEIV